MVTPMTQKAGRTASMVEDPPQVADGVQRLGTSLLWSGRVGEALAVLDVVFDRLLPAGGIINLAEALFWRGVGRCYAGDLAGATETARLFRAEAEHRSVHTRTHAYAIDGLIEFLRGDWAGLRATNVGLSELIDTHPDVSLCLATSAGIGMAAAVAVLGGKALPADLDDQMMRAVPESAGVRAASVLLPRAMTGDASPVAAGLAAYRSGLGLSDRMRVWDSAAILPAIGLTMLERWDDLEPVLARLDAVAADGGRVPGAVAAAVREERAAATGGGAGAPPRHEALLALECHGLSELLRYRPATRG